MGSDSVALPYLTPETNVTCFVEAALNRTAEAFDDEASFEAIASDCALPTLPFIPKDLNDAFTVLVIAVLGCGQQYCLIAALKSEAPSKVTMVRSLSIIFSFMFEAVASAVDPTTRMPRIENWLGAAIVFVATVSHMLSFGIVSESMAMRLLAAIFRQEWATLTTRCTPLR